MGSIRRNSPRGVLRAALAQRSIALLPLTLLLVPSLASAKPKKLSFEVNGGTLTLTFDPAKVTEAELRGAIELSPQMSPDSVTIEFLDSCRDGSGSTTPCAGLPNTPAQPAYFKDANIAVAKNKEIVKAAAERKVAKELEPARDYLRRQTAFYAGLEERKLAYYTSWKTADLAPPIEGIDGVKACAAIVAKLDAAAKPDKYKLAGHEWHNCMNDLGHNQFGEYPEAPWKAFLKAKGVTTKFAPQLGD